MLEVVGEISILEFTGLNTITILVIIDGVWIGNWIY
jgi:hypothetical protein